MDLQTLELKRNRIVFDAESILKTAERESRGLLSGISGDARQLLREVLTGPIKTTDCWRERSPLPCIICGAPGKN